MRHEALLRQLYSAFNAKDADGAVTALASDVDWPNRWEGGRVSGRDSVRDYWIRQWTAIDSRVEPIAVADRPDGSIEVTVRQVVRDKAGEVLSEQVIRHVYRFEGDEIRHMNVEE